jgi:hypothetical protein
MSADVQLLPRIKVNLAAERPAGGGTDDATDETVQVGELEAPLMVPLYADLVLTLMLDKGEHFELLKQGFREVNPQLSDADVINIGAAGLQSEVGDSIKLQGQPGRLMMATCGGNYEAALIIYPPFWDAIHQQFPGDVAVAIPTPDVIVVANADDEEALAELRASAKRVLDGPPASVTSARLYRKSPDSAELSFF